MGRRTAGIMAWSAALLLWAAAAVAGITDEVRGTVDEVVKIVGDKGMKKNPEERRRALRQAIGRIFDYTEMARRSLGPEWKKRTPEEQKEFTALFATLLENSYADKIESYNNEKIVYVRETVEGDHGEVRSKVVTARKDEYSLDYRLARNGTRWLVYDVVIEGVSLVSNYRSQFARIIKAGGYQDLVKKLRSKGKITG